MMNGMDATRNEPARALLSRLGVAHPIIQAPMAGADTPALAAAVSNAGGLGSLGAAYLTPDEIRDAIAEVRRRTDKPFNVNLFAGGFTAGPSAVATPSDPAAGGAVAGTGPVPPILAILRRHHAALGLPEPVLPTTAVDPFPAQLDAVLAARVPVFSFTFGIPPAADLARLREQGAAILGTATTVEEARRLAAAGVDAVVAQGSEAGAHRGTFAAPFERALIATMALVPQVVDAVAGLPVIASGGIMDGRGIVAARALGAAAAQMGTAFLACDEAAIPEAYKALLSSSPEDATAVTRAFSGRPARGLVNAFMRDVESAGEGALLPFPLQNIATRAMRAAARLAGDTDRLSLWAGQGLRLVRRLPAAELVRRLVAESEATLRHLAAVGP
jgi:nitronate monooxygenase